MVTRKEIVAKAFLGLIAGATSYLVQLILAVWGAFTPLANTIGGWLKMHVSADQVFWVSGLVLAVILYGAGLYVLRRWQVMDQGKDQQTTVVSPVAGTTGILNLGKGNTFVNTETTGFDHGVVDQGEESLWVRHKSSEWQTIRRPNYDKWDSRNEFRLVDLAWLWEDIEPEGYSMPVQVRTRFDRLASDWKANLIYFQQGNTIKEVAWDALDETRSGMASPHATASRDDLLAYARSIGDRPPFLFSRERISRSGVGNNYADALRDTAIGILSAVDGRVSANTARFDNQRHSDMARDMPTQLVRAPDLMNADKARLTPIQRQLITEYQFRQDEVETWINNSRVPGNTDVRIAKSMLHRLQNQQKALRNLIEHWDE